RIPWLPGAARERARFTMHGNDPHRRQPVDVLLGAALMTSRAALDRVGYLDERFFHYFSDVDWAWRFWENGLSVVYDPEAVMYHYYGRTSHGRLGILDPLVNRATRWHITDAVKYFAKHGIRGERPRSSSHA